MDHKEGRGITILIGYFDHSDIAMAIWAHAHHHAIDLIPLREVRSRDVLILEDIPSIAFKNLHESIVPVISIAEPVMEKIKPAQKKLSRNIQGKISQPFPKSKLLKTSFVGRHRR